MGGECYRFIRLKYDYTPTTDERVKYANQLLPRLSESVSNWAAKTELKGWTVRANSSEGIYIDCPDELFKAIVAPPQLDSTLNVGWQHRRYASCRDPKKDIAEEIMSILKQSAVAGILTEEEDTESWWRDLSGNYGQPEEEFTPHSGFYHTGQGDRVYCMQGEAEDFTACDKECGYCGRCQY